MEAYIVFFVGSLLMAISALIYVIINTNKKQESI